MAKVQFEYFGARLNELLVNAADKAVGTFGVPDNVEDDSGQTDGDATGHVDSIGMPSLRVNHAPQFTAPADMVSMAEASAITHLDATQIAQLAKELAMFGDAYGTQVKRSYGLSDAAYEYIKRTPVYINTFKKTQDEMQDNDALPIQLMANKMLLANLPVLNKLAKSSIAEPRDRLKAIDILSDLAGAGNRKPSSKPVTQAVQINFGAALGAKLSKTIIVEQP